MIEEGDKRSKGCRSNRKLNIITIDINLMRILINCCVYVLPLLYIVYLLCIILKYNNISYCLVYFSSRYYFYINC